MIFLIFYKKRKHGKIFFRTFRTDADELVSLGVYIFLLKWDFLKWNFLFYLR